MPPPSLYTARQSRRAASGPSSSSASPVAVLVTTRGVLRHVRHAQPDDHRLDRARTDHATTTHHDDHVDHDHHDHHHDDDHHHDGADDDHRPGPVRCDRSARERIRLAERGVRRRGAAAPARLRVGAGQFAGNVVRRMGAPDHARRAGLGAVRQLADDGFLVDADEQVDLRSLRLDGAQHVIDLRECRAGRPCYFISDRLLAERTRSRDGLSDGRLGLRRRAGGPGREHSFHLAGPPDGSTSCAPSGRSAASPSPPGPCCGTTSAYFLLHFPDLPGEDTTLVLTIRYADGGSDP